MSSRGHNEAVVGEKFAAATRERWPKDQTIKELVRSAVSRVAKLAMLSAICPFFKKEWEEWITLVS